MLRLELELFKRPGRPSPKTELFREVEERPAGVDERSSEEEDGLEVETLAESIADGE